MVDDWKGRLPGIRLVPRTVPRSSQCRSREERGILLTATRNHRRTSEPEGGGCPSMLSEVPDPILFVAYPMLAVSDGSCGGAEQMLWCLERELALRGAATVVAACEGSSVCGELVSTGAAPGEPDRFELREREHSESVVRLCRQRSFA